MWIDFKMDFANKWTNFSDFVDVVRSFLSVFSRRASACMLQKVLPTPDEGDRNQRKRKQIRGSTGN